jgi:two-component system sensor histidine kinase UhpB
MLEDRPEDAELILRELRQAEFAPESQRVDSESAYLVHLEPTLDVVLADYSMPGFGALRALDLLQERGWDIPLIIISGTIGEETAVAAMKQGAADYILKDRLTRLGPAITQALEQRRLRQEKTQAEEALRQSEYKYRHLFESLSEAAYLVDLATGRVLDTNRRGYLLLGRTRGEVVGMNETQMHPPGQWESWQERLAAADPRSLPLEFDGEIQHKENTRTPVRISAAPILLHDRTLVLALYQDITERKRTLEELQRTTQQLRGLSRRLLEVQETERRHIARELHDEIGQALTLTKINLQALSDAPDPAALHKRVQDCVAATDHLLQQVRDLSLNLRPPLLDDLGLAPALRWYVTQQGKRAGLRVDFRADESIPRLDTAVETACFRIGQEAVTNVLRHAHAKTLAVELCRADQSMRLTVRDDGVGFDPEAVQARAKHGASLGWLGMQERAPWRAGGWNIAPSRAKAPASRPCSRSCSGPARPRTRAKQHEIYSSSGGRRPRPGAGRIPVVVGKNGRRGSGGRGR